MAAAKAGSAGVRGEDLVEAARALAPMIRAESAASEKARRIPDHVFRAVREAGFFRIVQPRRFGGYELPPEYAVQIAYELAAADGSTGWVASCGMSHQWLAAQFPIACQEEVWRDGPDKMIVTSFTITGTTKAERVEGGFRLNGRWRYASGCDHADYALLGITPPPETEGGPAVPHFVLVPIGECRKVDDWDTMGLAATGSHALDLEDVFVPAHRSVQVPLIGTGQTPGAAAFETALPRYSVLTLGSHCLAATVTGCLQGAFESFVEGLKVRQTRGLVVGGGARVAEFPSVQMRVGRAGGALKAAKALQLSQLRHSQDMLLGRGESFDRAERIENRIAQAYSAQLALQGLDELWGATGAGGIHNAETVQRCWRDGHAASHHITFNWDATTTMYGQLCLGLEPQGYY